MFPNPQGKFFLNLPFFLKMALNTEELIETFKRIVATNKPSEYYKCLENMVSKRNDSFTYRCTSKKCRIQINVLEGTPFYKQKTPLEDLLVVLKMWFCDVKTKSIAELLGFDRSIVSHFLKKCFLLIIKNFEEKITKIGGKDIVVEIDESKFGKNKYHRGHSVKGVWVLEVW
jgi:hypothetical protein